MDELVGGEPAGRDLWGGIGRSQLPGWSAKFGSDLTFGEGTPHRALPRLRDRAGRLIAPVRGCHRAGLGSALIIDCNGCTAQGTRWIWPSTVRSPDASRSTRPGYEGRTVSLDHVEA